MMYLGDKAVGLNSFISKNIPAKWDIVEYIPNTSSGWQTVYHSLGVTPDIFMIVPDTFDDSIKGQTNPSMIFGSNGIDSSTNRQRTVLNYLNNSNNWDYTANVQTIYCEKDNEKVKIYASNNFISANKKYYFIIIAFNKGGDT